MKRVICPVYGNICIRKLQFTIRKRFKNIDID